MKNQKILLGLLLFSLGFLGVLSILTMDIPLPEEVQTALSEHLTSQQIRLILLINPTIMLAISIIVGLLLYQTVHLKVPLLERAVGIEQSKFDVSDIVLSGVWGGVLSGALLSVVGLVFTPVLPEEFLELGESLQPTLPARFLYGGITEEILMRFGLMTLVVWIASKVFRSTISTIYWIGIIIAAVMFAVGHFPIAYQVVESPSTGLLSYILIGNTIGGLIFGWLYWKKGLESAFVAHIFAHVTMVIVALVSDTI